MQAVCKVDQYEDVLVRLLTLVGSNGLKVEPRPGMRSTACRMRQPDGGWRAVSFFVVFQLGNKMRMMKVVKDKVTGISFILMVAQKCKIAQQQ